MYSVGPRSVQVTRQAEGEIRRRLENSLESIFKVNVENGPGVEIFLGARVQPVYLRGNNSIRSNINERFFLIRFLGANITTYAGANFLHSMTSLYQHRNVGFEKSSIQVEEERRRIFLSAWKEKAEVGQRATWPKQLYEVRIDDTKRQVAFMAHHILQFGQALSKALNWYSPPVRFGAKRVNNEEYEPMVAVMRSGKLNF